MGQGPCKAACGHDCHGQVYHGRVGAGLTVCLDITPPNSVGTNSQQKRLKSALRYKKERYLTYMYFLRGL